MPQQMYNRHAIPLCRPTIDADEIAAVEAVLRSGWITTGPRVGEFERAWAEYCGAPYGVALSSATAGLHTVLASLGVKPGDEVITVSLTWPSTANVIELLGATTVFADVLPGTLLMDMTDVERKLTSPRPLPRRPWGRDSSRPPGSFHPGPALVNLRVPQEGRLPRKPASQAKFLTRYRRKSRCRLISEDWVSLDTGR